ncbi:alpha/beta hydrolase [Moritella sp. F3]|uniref:alpha/beta hydrolase n=1 Tax=Moritella sp. F3 TaxID=2718882 RepID=UPI0018E119F5|nr:alpha/beta fold hydrolase [Moritella sp. F3]GIC78216.1 esterase [Moritella sp. F1]GIC81140.1 esterase [Moritella sp. F3]
MSSNIYFNTRGKFTIRRSMINIGTRLHHSIAPKHALKTARNLLLTPVRSTSNSDDPEGLLRSTHLTSEGRLNTYQMGNGPVWILSHGWSGSASQFFPLMEHIAAQGFTALAYDHPAHGQSEGRHAHLPAFVQAFDELIDNVDDVAGIIAHSMGSASVLESRHPKVDSLPLLLIAPVLNYVDNLYEMVGKSGYSMKLFGAMITHIEDKYEYSLDTINPYQKLISRQHATTIVHDKRDRFADFTTSESAANTTSNINLIATKGQGHGRVIKCDSTMAAFDSLI